MTEVKSKSELLDYSQSDALDGVVKEQSIEVFSFELELVEDGQRIDKILSARFPEVSRSRIKELIDQKKVNIDGFDSVKPSQKGSVGQKVSIALAPRIQDLEFEEIPMDLDIIYEDNDILIINKPAGLVVHPAAGHWNDTLLNGLLAYNEVFKKLPRAGIVHRLDKDTSGLMVVAKTELAQLDLVRQLQERTVKREYWAIVKGVSPETKLLNASIERDPHNPLRFIVSRSSRAKPAITEIKRIDQRQFKDKKYSWVAARLQTGRTHQIRLHMESLGFPLVGDPLYRNRLPQTKDDSTIVGNFHRQALHASRLGLIHPSTGQTMEWFAPPPPDFIELMKEIGFGPWDKPTEVFDQPIVSLEEKSIDLVGRISSWNDFDFGEDETDDELWDIQFKP